MDGAALGVGFETAPEAHGASTTHKEQTTKMSLCKIYPQPIL